MRNLPLGYRFFPTEEELVGFYLPNKLKRRREEDLDRVIPVVDIYSLDPWMLPSISGELCIGGEQWFFFSPRQEREVHGGRPNRITPSGYWKATGTPNYIYSDNRIIGLKRTMVFYEGKAPVGKKTKWKVNEYKAIEEDSPSGTTPKLQHEFSLCRIYLMLGSMRSFDRRPLITGTSEVSNTAGSRGITSVEIGNTSGASASNSAELSQQNPSMASMAEQDSSFESSSPKDHAHHSPAEETSNHLNMINDDLDVVWDSLTWD